MLIIIPPPHQYLTHSPTTHPSCRPADFGLSEMLDPERTHVSNHNKGTPFYMAPEITQHQQVPYAVLCMHEWGIYCVC